MDDAGSLDARYLDDLKDRVARSPVHQWVGLGVEAVGDGEARLAVDLQPQHFNQQGIVHGGVISLLADTAIGLALRSRLRPGLTHRTAQLNVHFLRHSERGRLVGIGRAVHSGKRMGYGEAEVRDDQDELLARASATFIVLAAPGAF